MCAPAPIGEVAGITTILLIPAKLAPVMPGPWQAAQLLVIPVWLISEPLNRAPLPTGKLATLDPGPTWHASHATVVGIWLLGGPTIVKLAAGIAKPATTLAA